ncbi:uncharacterized protein LOC126335634 [Schistocerca gregaria]|uniref:uncharacterized protein LOC126335634 n=1 Tax=Schistocerca gregaria TaxID=7010 RepID=UPI00211DAEBF|nr:uncharacterized protein LOC126335634 [Schistocerca gregaria]
MLTPSPQLVDDFPRDNQQTPAASPALPHTPDPCPLRDLSLNPLPGPSLAPPPLDAEDVPMPLAQPDVASQPPLLRRSSRLVRKAAPYSPLADSHGLLQEDLATDKPTAPGCTLVLSPPLSPVPH